MTLPGFLVIGAMRCGTTTLWELLDRHERVFLPETKELHYFDDRDGALGRGLDWYVSHFEPAAPGRLAGECSPSYLYVDGTAERIRAALPDVRLVAILRDPVARAWSHYWFNVRRGRERLSFEKALEREPERLAAGDPQTRDWYSYADRGHYAEQLARYERLFPDDQLLVVLLDDLIADPAAVTERVLGHFGLGLDGVSTTLVPERNRGRYPRSRRVHTAFMRAKHWSEGRNAAARAAVGATAGAVRRLNLTTSAPRMAPATRARLRETFRASDAELARRLGRELPWA